MNYVKRIFYILLALAMLSSVAFASTTLLVDASDPDRVTVKPKSSITTITVNASLLNPLKLEVDPTIQTVRTRPTPEERSKDDEPEFIPEETKTDIPIFVWNDSDHNPSTGR
jgi:uncharacterized metal-binding protein YceD (DUF177 family)